MLSFLIFVQFGRNIQVECIFREYNFKEHRDTIRMIFFVDSIVFLASPSGHIYEGKWFSMRSDSIHLAVKFWIYDSELVSKSDSIDKDTVHFTIFCFYNKCAVISPSIGLKDQTLCNIDNNM